MARKKTPAPVADASTVIAYKGFDKALACRGYQYAVGETFTHTGSVAACSSGFHACRNPLDVFGYYEPTLDNRFCRVTLTGALDENGGDTKVAASVLTVDEEIGLAGMIAASVDYLFGQAAVDPNDDSTLAASGNGSTLAASGYGSRLAASGNGSTLAASGNGSTGSVGENGAIALAYWDGKRTRFAVGYVGEDGIKANVRYRADSATGKLVAA